QRYRLAGQQLVVTTHRDHRRRSIDGGEARRVVRLAGGKGRRAKFCREFDLAFDLSLGRNADGGLAAGAAGEAGPTRDPGGGVAIEAFEQVKERDGADAMRPREPQPVRPLSPRERAPFHADGPGGSGGGVAALLFWPILGSVPATIRPMLERCRQYISTAS